MSISAFDAHQRGVQLGLRPPRGQLRLHLAQRAVHLGVGGAGRDAVALRRAGLRAQRAAAGLDHRQIGVAVGLGSDDLVEFIRFVLFVRFVLGALAHTEQSTSHP